MRQAVPERGSLVVKLKRSRPAQPRPGMDGFQATDGACEYPGFTERTNGRMDGWMDGWLDGWLDGWMDGWLDGWMDGWADGWMAGWVGGRRWVSLSG